MARSSLQIIVDQRTPLTQSDANPKNGRQLLRKVVRHLEGILGGKIDASHLQIQTDGGQPVAASATVALASVQANDTLLINGATITAVSGTPAADQFKRGVSDIADATSLCAAGILATGNQALVLRHVEASNWAGIVALATCTAGTCIEIAGHQFTAISAANSTTQGNPNNFSISGSDSADGDALVTAINAHPVLAHQVVASNSSGTVTIRQRRGTAALGKIYATNPSGVASAPSGVTITQFAATATVLVSALHEGHSGNAITLAQGVGATMTCSAARLSGGTGSATGTMNRIVIGGSAN